MLKHTVYLNSRGLRPQINPSFLYRIYTDIYHIYIHIDIYHIYISIYITIPSSPPDQPTHAPGGGAAAGGGGG